MPAADLPSPDHVSTIESIGPDEAGWDTGALESVVDFVGQHQSNTFLVLHRGRVVAERYWEADADFRRDIASAQKSIVSFLVGVAQEKGLLAIDDPVTRWLGPGWSNEPDASLEGAITLRHLISMDAGLDHTLKVTAPPATVWAYNNNAYHESKKVVEAAAKASIQEITEEWLWSRIGCTTSAWEPRARMLDGKGVVMTGYITTARDMARFGQLMAQDCRWGDEVLLADTDYLRDSVSPSQTMNPSYGYLWWLAGQPAFMAPMVAERFDRTMVPQAPPGAFGALGAADQKIWVAPERGIVWVRQGNAAYEQRAALSGFDGDVWQRLLAVAPAP